MAKMRYWDGKSWITLDANDSDTVDGRHASSFADKTHKHQAEEVNFKDGQSLQYKMDSGSLKPDSVHYYFTVKSDGNLYMQYNTGDNPPKYTIKPDGNLYVVI